MDYTSSSNYVTHYGTGQRMHEANQALPTVVSDQDMNMVLWSLMEVVKESGLPGIPFSKDSPTSYQRLRDALRVLYTPKNECSSVPTSNKGLMIVVTQPHLRVMVWNGSQYVRAPWHQPCQLFFSYDNPASIHGALPVRGDVSYQQANYPDLVARLGLSGNGTFTLAEARGEFIRVLDNGRGADVGRTLGSAQGDAIRNITGEHSVGSLTSNDWGIGAFSGMNSMLKNALCSVGASQPQVTSQEVVRFDASLIVPTAEENRPRNLAYPLWITY